MIQEIKKRFKLDNNFIKRLPKINIYQEQLSNLNKQTLQYYKDFLVHKLKWTKSKEDIQKWMSFPGRFKQNEVDFFKQLRKFINPPKVNQQYQRPLDVDIKRGEQRAKMFMKLYKSIPSLKGKVLKIGADDACGSGVISKVLAKTFNLERIDMFDPYVPETKISVENLKKYKLQTFESNFYSIPFEKRLDKKQKYDCVFLLAALHHITNPIEVIDEIKKSLNPGGLLFVREHLPKNQQEKMLLDCQELSWSYAIQLEEPDGMQKIKDKTYIPQSYFTEKELYELIDMKLLGKLPEINYIQNEFMNYFIFQKPM